MTHRAKLYLKNRNGRKKTLIVFKGRLSMSMVDGLHRQIDRINAMDPLPTLIGLTIPEGVEAQVIKL